MFSFNKPNQNASKDHSKAITIPELKERPVSHKNVIPDYRKHEKKIQNIENSRINNEQNTSLTQHLMRKKKNTIEDDSDDVEVELVHAYKTDLSTSKKHYAQQSRNEPYKNKKNVVNEYQKQTKGSEQTIVNRYKAYVPGQESSRSSKLPKSPALESRKLDRNKNSDDKKTSSKSYYGTSPWYKFDYSRHQNSDKHTEGKNMSSKYIGDKFPSPSHSIKSNNTAMNAYRNRKRSISKESDFSRGAKSNISVNKFRQHNSPNKNQKSNVWKQNKSKRSNLGSPKSRQSKTETISDNAAGSKNTPKANYKEWRKQKFEEYKNKKKSMPAKVIQTESSYEKSKFVHQKHHYDKLIGTSASKNFTAYTPNKQITNEKDRSKSKGSVARDNQKAPTKSLYQTEKKQSDVKNKPVFKPYVPRSELQLEKKKLISEKDEKAKSQSKSIMEYEPVAPRIQSPFNFDNLPDIPKISSSNTQKSKPFTSHIINEGYKNIPSPTPNDLADKHEREGYVNKNQFDYQKQDEKTHTPYVPKHVRNEQSEKYKSQKDDTRKRQRSVSREDYHKSPKYHKHARHSESYREFDRDKDKFDENPNFKKKDSTHNYDGYQNTKRDRSSHKSDIMNKDIEDKDIRFDKNMESASPEKRRDKKAANRSPSITFPEPKNSFRPVSDRKFYESVNMERIENNNESMKQQIILTPKIQHIEQESPTLIHMNQNLHQQSAESEIKISPEKSYEGKEKLMSNLESEILNDADSDSVNSKDDFWNIALPSSPIDFLQNSEDSIKDNKNLMHVDSEAQEFGIKTQNKSQPYNDPPRAFQLYAAYMKNNPSKEKISDVEMANENNSLIVK